MQNLEFLKKSKKEKIPKKEGEILMVRYEYETSPRKLEPEYIPNKKKKTDSRRLPKKKEQANSHTKNKKITKSEESRKKAKTVLYVFIAFAVLITISYRNSLITENFNKVEELKENLNAVKKQNEQLTVSIENSLNLKNVEQAAKENGMQKLTTKQTVYVNLPKKDYVEPSSEKIQMDEEENIFQKIINSIKNIFK